jgi:phenylpropionate dioxygenase-like ring-hydroxylating dioxygenase large terminal subunit
MERPKGHVSAVKLPDAWFIACASRELKARPLARTVQDNPLVLFRDEQGKPAALLDRCPHRNVPLSAGTVDGGLLQCGYHGWRFDGSGACRAIPGLVGDASAKGRRAQRFATAEHDGFVWVYSTPEVEPRTAPFRFPRLDDPAYSTVRRVYSVPATMHATIENALDVPHTAFLHGGLFRTATKRNDIEVVMRRTATTVEAEYIGEPRPPGLTGRIIAPGGGVVVHYDRFLLPSIAQVEYHLGERSHLYITSALTPESDFQTRLWAVVTFCLPLPHFLVRPVLQPIGGHIFKQDARILRMQTDVIHRFDGEQFASTELDVLGPQIWLLLKNASRGAEAAPVEPLEHRLTMRV